MDRIIAARAIIEGLALVTADQVIHNLKALQTARSILGRAELRAHGRFKRGNNPGGKVGDLRVGEGGFAALESYPDHQRIFS